MEIVGVLGLHSGHSTTLYRLVERGLLEKDTAAHFSITKYGKSALRDWRKATYLPEKQT